MDCCRRPDGRNRVPDSVLIVSKDCQRVMVDILGPQELIVMCRGLSV